MRLQKRYEQNKHQLDEAANRPIAPAVRQANPRATSLALGEELESVRGALGKANEALARVASDQQLQSVDPARVRPSHLKNRDERSFERTEFQELRASIQAAGGNTVPVELRRIQHTDFDFELVYGHRRHRACLETGLPLLAVIHDGVDDKALYQAMTRENSQRDDLSPWEWGQHYARGLSSRFYETQKELAADNGRSEAHVSFALDLVALPEDVLAAFESPLQMQLKWGRELAKDLARARKAMLAKASELADRRGSLPATQVFNELRQTARSDAQLQGAKRAGRAQIRGKRVTARLVLEPRRTAVEIPKRLSDEQQLRLSTLIIAFLDAEFTR